MTFFRLVVKEKSYSNFERFRTVFSDENTYFSSQATGLRIFAIDFPGDSLEKHESRLLNFGLVFVKIDFFLNFRKYLE